MKKFLTTIIVIIIAVSLGFGVFYLVKDNEVISIKTASLYKNVNEKFSFGLDLQDPNSYTKIEVYSTDEKVLKVTSKKVEIDGNTAMGEFEAVAGGVAKIVFKTNNAKFRNVTCDVVVCDGSISYPFRIFTAEELVKIGNDPVYTLDKCYELANDIDLGTILDINAGDCWEPLGEYSGSFNGMGYTIENLVLGNTYVNNGLFSKITKNGKVENVRFSNVVVKSENAIEQNMGAVAGMNCGSIERVEVKGIKITCTNSNAVIGGVVGENRTTIGTNNSVSLAQIDRASAIIEATDACSGTIGGVVGKNIGGKIVLSYSRGAIKAGANSIIGGIVGLNSFAKDSIGNNKTGAMLQEGYSTLNITKNDGENPVIGGIIGKNDDASTTAAGSVNKISGMYYESGNSGVGKVNDSVGKVNDKEYCVMKADGTYGVLTDLSTLISAVSGKYTYSEDSEGNGQFVLAESDKVYYFWNTGVWETKVGENDGYPVINFKDVDFILQTGIDGTLTKVASKSEFIDKINANLNGTFIIEGVIDLAGDWEPIGTEAAPFTGRIYGLSNSLIKGLTVSGKANAGLFGYVGQGAVIDGLSFEGATVSGNYAGIIAGVNYGQIQNFSFKSNCSVTANTSGGAVAGSNHGKIYGYSGVNSINGLTPNGLIESCEIVAGASNVNLGGVAGENHGTIESDDKNKVISVKKVTLKDGKGANYLGGVAGINHGNIERVEVESLRIVYPDSAKANSVGGVAGYNYGNISVATVKEVTLSGQYVGGVAGQVFFKEDDKSVSACKVSDASITGDYAGGITASLNVGYSVTINISVNYLKILYSDITTITNLNTLLEKPQITNVMVDNTSLMGGQTGGIVSSLEKGVVSDAYVNVDLRGGGNAGIAYSIGYKATNGSCGEGGLISNVVAIVKGSSGVSYSSSANQIHKQPVPKSRNVGFIVNYHFFDVDNKLRHQTHSGIPFINPHMGLNEYQMKFATNWSFLNNNRWIVKDGEIPRLYIM